MLKTNFDEGELCYFISYRSPLHNASEKGHLDVVKYLIEKGANLDAKGKFR